MDKQSKSNNASITRREGKRLRWARNICRKWLRDGGAVKTHDPILYEIVEQRYERAVALIVAHKLSQ